MRIDYPRTVKSFIVCPRDLVMDLAGMSRRGTRCALLAGMVILMFLVMPARAQGKDGGYIGRGTGTEEVDDCIQPRGLSASEAENQAADHYDRGINLYEQGDYEAAIAEFVAAYCHKPYFQVLKDIAQSFERMVDYEKAVAYLERYILETPDDRAEERQVQSARVQVLRNLPARVRIATAPPGASVTLSSDSGVRARGLSNDRDPLLIRKGVYSMTIELDGYQTVSETIEVKIGQPYSYYYRLEPKRGTLRVMTVPSRARIFVDKRRVAVGSHVAEVPIGKYEIEAEAEGYLSAQREVEISEASQGRVVMSLEPIPRSGRTELLIAASLGGAIWGGGTLGTVFGQDSLIGPLGGALGLGIGFGGAYLGVPRDISVGTSSFIIGSTLIGTAEGVLAARFFSCEDEEGEDGGPYESTECSDDAQVAIGLAAGLGGTVFAALAAPRLELDAGDAAIINSGALWGAISGALFYEVFDRDARVGELLVFSGLNLGILTGALVAQRAEVSRGHVALIDLSGLAGLILGAATVNIVVEENSSNERLPHLSLMGMTIGLITGAYLTRHMDEPPALPALSPSVGATTTATGKSTMTLGVRGAF